MTQKGFVLTALVVILSLLAVGGLIAGTIYLGEQAKKAAISQSPTPPHPTISELPIQVDPDPNRPADLFISISGPSTATAGSTVAYSLTFGNNGPAAAPSAFISLLLPNGVTYVSDTTGGPAEQTPFGQILDLGTIPAGTQRTATLSLLVAPTVSTGTVLDTVLTIESSTIADIIRANNRARATIQVIAP